MRDTPQIMEEETDGPKVGTVRGPKDLTAVRREKEGAHVIETGNAKERPLPNQKLKGNARKKRMKVQKRSNTSPSLSTRRKRLGSYLMNVSHMQSLSSVITMEKKN